MNYVVLILVAIVGIALGMYIARQKANTGFIAEQSVKKTENKQKIIAFVQEHVQIKNDDVEKLAGVSNATAERYLSELEKEGKLAQHGKIGQSVFYTLK
jgi:predicted HTH transcriptional regulator